MRLLLLLLLVVPGVAAADCVCRCVDGQVVPLCTSTLDLAPLCAPTLCPLPPAELRPLDSVTLPPLGTTRCYKAMVYNPKTDRYEWQDVCR